MNIAVDVFLTHFRSYFHSQVLLLPYIVLNKTNQILLEAYRVLIPHYPRAASILTLPQECILEFKFDIKQKLIRLILTHI